MSLNRSKLEKFVKTRNTSDFHSNLQFSIDAEACGFDVDELGQVQKISDGHYKWLTPYGELTEYAGELSLS